MKVIVPAGFTSTSTVPADDYPAWSSATTYAKGARVVTAATDQVWQSAVDGNLNKNPTTQAVVDDVTYWLLVGATDRKKPFDKKVGEVVTRPGDISWTLTMTDRADTIALFGVGAATVRIQVNMGGSSIYDQTKQSIDTSDIVDWFSFFTWDPKFESELIVSDLPAYAGAQVVITLSSGGGATSVSEIVIGKAQTLGTTLEGTTVGINDYSTKTRDEWGGIVIQERAFSDETTFQFSLPMTDARRVKRILAALRATPAVYFVDDATSTQFGTTVYGFFSDFEIPLTHGLSFANLKIEGLT